MPQRTRLSRTTAPNPFWRLKRLRELKGLTLDQLAMRAGLTKSYLSKVERGISVPSIATALKLSDAFEVAIGDLLGVSTPASDFVVVRKSQRKPFGGRKGEKAGYRYEAIAPSITHGLFEAFVMQPPLEEPRGLKRFQHGGQEMIFVLKGKIEVAFPHHTTVLAPGDSILFSGRLPHRSLSVGTQHAEALVIVTNDKAGSPVPGSGHYKKPRAAKRAHNFLPAAMRDS